MLKQTLIITIICFITVNICHAQFSKSTIYASGFGSYSWKQDNSLFTTAKTTTRNTTLTPSIGFFPIKNLLVGGMLNWNSTKSDTDSPTPGAINKSLTKSFDAGPFIRYYIVKGLYAETGYFWGKSKFTTSLSSPIFDQNGGIIMSDTYDVSFISHVNGYIAGMGYVVFLGKSHNIGLDFGILYRGYFKSSNYYNGLSASAGLSAFLFRTKE